MGKVLIACEESQTVCKAFRERGHEAYSCDIQEPSGGHPEWHIHGDAVAALQEVNKNPKDIGRRRIERLFYKSNREEQDGHIET